MNPARVAALAATLVACAPALAQQRDWRTPFMPEIMPPSLEEQARDAERSGDMKTAIELLVKLARGGNAAAADRLGQIYEYGLGVEPDREQALKWYAFARIQRPGDMKEAIKALVSQARSGNAASAHQLGQIYERGLGVERDPQEARKWYNFARTLGHQIPAESK